MKRFIGWGLVVLGGAATIWGGFSVMTGESERARIAVTHDFSINALTCGLIGLAVLTLGLVWVRD
jgi:hypothetical protein